MELYNRYYCVRVCRDVIFVFKLKREEETLDNIKQYYVKCSNMDNKYEAITNIYATLSVGQAVIFCHTRRTAAWLAKKMCEDEFVVALLTGELDVTQRASILKRLAFSAFNLNFYEKKPELSLLLICRERQKCIYLNFKKVKKLCVGTFIRKWIVLLVRLP